MSLATGITLAVVIYVCPVLFMAWLSTGRESWPRSFMLAPLGGISASLAPIACLRLLSSNLTQRTFHTDLGYSSYRVLFGQDWIWLLFCVSMTAIANIAGAWFFLRKRVPLSTL